MYNHEIETELYKAFAEAHIYPDYLSVMNIDDDVVKVVFDIEWGDWKHEHGHAFYVVTEYFFKKKLYLENTDERVTEEDGSDCYSAEHTLWFNSFA